MKTCDQCSIPIEDGEEFKDGPLVICWFCHTREFGEEQPRRTRRRRYDEEDDF